MDNLANLEKILAAAHDLGKNLQSDAEKLRAENSKLNDEIKKLRADNERLKSDSDSFLEEIDTLENAMKDFRAANETFIVNIDKLMKQLNTAINDSHEKFMAQINSLMRDEFQKFLLEYMNKVKPNEQPAAKKQPQKNSAEGKKKSNEHKSQAGLVQVTSSGEMIFSEPEPSAVANDSGKKKKEVYAEFYAEETVSN